MKGTDALIFFFGLFWATSLASVGRYRLFDTQLLSRAGKPWQGVKRLTVGLLLVNAGPVALLWLLHEHVVSDATGLWPVVSAAVGSLSVFGVSRITHAFVASDPVGNFFYDDDEKETVLRQWGRSGPNGFFAHFVWGVLWIVAYVGAAALLA